MKKTKGMQRLWAFLLAFVLIATTVGNDGLTVLASENETEQSSEASSETHSAEASENTNSGGEEENSGENKSNQEEASESSSESASESSEESSAESTSVSQEEELTTETSEEESKTEENTESISEEANQNSKWKVNFNTEGDVKVFKEDGQEITGTLEVENGKQLSFKVEAGEGTSVKVTADNNELSSENGIYKINPDKDITVTVKAEKNDNAEASTETETETETITESAAETESETETETKTEAETETESETETEIETESEIETETEEILETETEDVIREFSVVSFQVEGKGSITDADGDEIGSQVEVENKKSLEFYVNPEDGYEVAEVIIDGTVISRSDNKYAVSPSKDVEVKVTFVEKEEEEEEYVETIDTVEVNGVTIKVTTYSEGVLPKGYKVVAEEVSAGTVQNAVETKLEEKGKELVDLRAFDITILDKDGNEIQPKGGVSVQILGTGVEGENFDIYHMSGDEAQSVAENRKNSDVSFTANSFSIYVLAGSGWKYVTKSETIYLKVGETKTLSAGNLDSSNNWSTSNKNIVEIDGNKGTGFITITGVNQGTAVITHEYENIYGKNVKETTTIKVTSDDKQAVTAYFYVLLPEKEIGSTIAKDYFYVGQGSVIPYDGDTQKSDLVQHQGTSNVVTYPDKEQVLQAVKQQYGSDIEVKDVIWYKTPWANGANSNDKNKPWVSAGTKCYHVDGYVSYSTVNYTTVAFKAVPPGAGADSDENSFELVDYYNKVKLLDKKATVTPTTNTATSINGYVFEGWYSDKACTQKVTDWTINGPTTYYGHYVPNMDDTRELKYQVVYQTEEGTILDTVTEKVNIWVEADSYIVEKVESKTFTGYKQKDDSPKLPQEVKDNDKVIVLYEADKNAKVEVKYTVQHWVAGVHQSDDDVEVTDKVWVNDAKELKVTADSLAKNTYTGYKFSSYAPADIKAGSVVADKQIIRVNYEKDEDAKVEVKYTVQHWVAGVHQSDDDVEVTDKVWVNDAKELKVTADSLAKNTYTGYKFSSYAPADIKAGSIVADKQIIRVNYEKDEDAKVEVKYTVQHWVAGVHQSDDDVEVTDKVWVNGAKELTVTADSLAQNTYPGYKFSSYAPADIKAGSVVADKQIIRVNYEKDEDAKVEVKYTVQHWVAGVHQSDDDVEVTDKVWVNSAKELTVTADSLAQNTYPGYKFSSYAPADIKAGSVVADKQIIRVNYEKDEDAKVEVKYTVQHWVAGVHQSDDDVEVTDKVWVNDAKELKVTADSLAKNIYTGYKFSSYAPADIKAGSVVADKQIIRVNYEKDEDAKVEVKYTVQHWVAGVHQSDDDVEVTDKVWVNDAKELTVTADSLAKNTYTGYKFSGYAPADIKAGSVVADKQIIRVNYEKDEDAKVEVKYTVQHWVAGVHQLNDDVEVTDKVWVNDAKELTVTADSLAKNTYTGYKFSSYAPADIKAGSVVADKQIIRVDYEKDEDAKVEVKYTVQHWVAGVHQSDDDVEVTDKVWVNDAKELTVTADSLAKNTYTGYKFSSYAPADIKAGSVVADKQIIRVDYEKDEDAKVEVKYTVQHWVAGVHQADDDVEVTDKVWVNGAKELKVTADSLAKNTYPGYKFSSYAPADIKAGSVVADKQIIRVNYEKDEDAKVEVKYTVQHWVAGVHQSDDDVEVTDKVWVNGAKELTVTADSLAKNTYPGYKFSSYAPADIKAGSVVADKQIIRVNYEKDEDAKVEVKYTVQHWVAGVHQSDDDVEVTDKVWVNGAKELTVTADSLAKNTYPGYKFSSYAPADIKAGSVVADKQIIRVNYEKDEDAKVEVKYTVQHWVAGVHQSDDDVEVTDKVWVNGAKELTVTADSLAKNTYPGYKFSSYAPADIKAGSVVADKQIIRVNYEKDEGAKVEVKYTVQHWVAGVHQSDDDVEVTDKVWVNGAKELTVTADSLAKNTYPGYKFSSYAPADIKAGSVVADKQIIRVNYEKDEDAKVEVKYTVQHWVAGVHQSDDDVEVTDKVWVNGAKELTVTADSLAKNTYPGYKFSSYAPADIKAGSVVADKQIIRVNYEKDEDAKVEVKYTVQHWVAGVHQSDDDVEVTDKVWVNGAKELKVTADSLAQNNYTGYTFNNYDPEDIKEGMTVSDGDVIKVNYLENEVTIKYIADANGNVNNDSETILAINGTATGSTATAAPGYHFVNWTNEDGTVVSTDETYVPQRVNELYAAATYTAHFEEDVVTPPAPTPTPDEPTETTPTGTTPTVTAPTEATAVLGEAFAPVQPEVGVLGEAAAPEVGVLGEAKGPGTGDTAPIAAWSLIIVGAILTLGISAKKRKKEEQ